jgi:hypothetical protein
VLKLSQGSKFFSRIRVSPDFDCSFEPLNKVFKVFSKRKPHHIEVKPLYYKFYIGQKLCI